MTQIPTEKWSVDMEEVKKAHEMLVKIRSSDKAAAILPEEPEKEWRGKWMNIYFSKCGKTHLGQFFHDTEDKALKMANKAIKEYSDKNMVWETDYSVKWKDTTHAIPMPIVGDNQ